MKKTLNRNEELRIGDIVFAEIHGEGHTQDGDRPAVVIQNDVGNKHSTNLIVFPITGRIRHTYLPTHVVLSAKTTGMPKDSMVLCENPVTLPQENVKWRCGALSREDFSRVCKAALVSMPFDKYIA